MDTATLIRDLLSLTKADPRAHHHWVVLDHGCCAGALVDVYLDEGVVVLCGESDGTAMSVKATIAALRALDAGKAPTLIIGGCSDGEVGSITSPRRKEVLLVLA